MYATVLVIHYCVRSQPFEDRVKELCARAVSAVPSELDSIIQELKAALHEHTERLRKLAADKLSVRV
jgi:hypothetical protein